MIELIDVSKYYVTDFGKHYVFRNVSLVLPPDRSVGVMGPNGAGKSTFLRLIAGADVPSEGSILRSGRISPPMGLTPGLQGSMTAAENARFAGRIYGLDRDEINDMIEYVRKTANIGKYFDEPVSEYSAGMKQRVSFAINMSMNFDYYLFDEISAGGDKEFRKMAKEMLLERLRTARFVLTSHRIRDLLEFCQSGIVIREGELTYFDDINDAVKFYGEDDDDDDDEPASGRHERRKVREERRRRREEDRASLTTRAAPESAILLGAPESAISTPYPDAIAVKQNTLETASAVTDQPVEEEAERELRRQKREERRRARSALTEAVAQQADESIAATEAQYVNEPLAAVAPAGISNEPDVEGDDTEERQRETRRQRRAERQRLKAGQAEAVGTDGALIVEPGPAIENTAVASGGPSTDADGLDAAGREAARAARRAAAEERRQQRRAERERGETAAAQTVSEIATDAAEVREQAVETGPEGAPQPHPPVLEGRQRKQRRTQGVTGTADQPADGTWSAAAQTPHASDVMATASEHGLPASRTNEAAPTTVPVPDTRPEPTPVDGSGIWYAEASGEVTGADRKLLLVRLLMRQERAQQKASRAARLLLQHLDAPVDETAQSRSGRALLVKAAQDIAATEAAAARGLLEQALAHEGGDREAEPPSLSGPSFPSAENRWAN